MLTYDFHDMKLKFLCQHIQSGCERFLAITYQLQVLLCIVREGQPHFPVLLRRHSQRSEGNTWNDSEQLIISLGSHTWKKRRFHLMKLVRGSLYENCTGWGVPTGNWEDTIPTTSTWTEGLFTVREYWHTAALWLLTSCTALSHTQHTCNKHYKKMPFNVTH